MMSFHKLPNNFSIESVHRVRANRSLPLERTVSSGSEEPLQRRQKLGTAPACWEPASRVGSWKAGSPAPLRAFASGRPPLTLGAASWPRALFVSGSFRGACRCACTTPRRATPPGSLRVLHCSSRPPLRPRALAIPVRPAARRASHHGGYRDVTKGRPHGARTDRTVEDAGLVGAVPAFSLHP